MQDVNQAADIFLQQFRQFNTNGDVDAAKRMAWNRTIEIMPAVGKWRVSFNSQLRKAGGMKFERRYGARKYQALIQKIGANIRASAPEKAEEVSEPVVSEPRRSMLDTLVAWIDAHDYAPDEHVLSHFAGGTPGSWRTTYTRLRSLGYDYIRADGWDNCWFEITQRPSLESKVKQMSRDDLAKLPAETLAELLYNMIQS